MQPTSADYPPVTWIQTIVLPESPKQNALKTACYSNLSQDPAANDSMR